MRTATLFAAFAALTALGSAEPIGNRLTLDALLTSSTTEDFEAYPVNSEAGANLGMSVLDASTGWVAPGAAYVSPVGYLQWNGNNLVGLVSKTLGAVQAGVGIEIHYAAGVRAFGLDAKAYDFTGGYLAVFEVYDAGGWVETVPFFVPNASSTFIGYRHNSDITCVVLRVDTLQNPTAQIVIDNHTYGSAPPLATLDTDGDGLSDVDEATFGTDLNDPDSDDDGLWDGTEVDMAQGSGCPSPTVADSDGDGLSDGDEVGYGANPGLGTSPCNPDTDGDGLGDAIDPTPTMPGATNSWIEAELRGASDAVGDLALGEFDAPNNNARKGRRNALSNQLASVANEVARGRTQQAIDKLESLWAKIDGEPHPRDWMVDGPAKDALSAQVLLLKTLLEYP